MFSFSHLSASHNSNNGNPKKHWRAPPWGDSAIWEAARRSLETSVVGRRKSPSVHCSKPTAPLADGCCRRKHHVFSASAVPKVRFWSTTASARPYGSRDARPPLRISHSEPSVVGCGYEAHDRAGQ